MALADFCSICLPYCLKRQKGGGYVALNREYKPLGFKASAFLDYGDFPVTARYQGITPQLAAELSWNDSADLDYILLYDDSTRPTIGAEEMHAYLTRLAKLARLTVEV